MRSRASTTLLVAIGALVALFAVQAATGVGGQDNPLFVDWLGGGLPFASAGMCIVAARRVAAERAVWLTLGLGMLVWALGNAYYLAFLADLADPPVPSLADAGYIAFYPFAYAGCVMLLRARLRGAPSSVWLDGVIGGLSAASVVAAVVLDAVIAATGGATAVVATTLAAPVGDLVLLAIVLGSVTMAGRLPLRFAVLAAGFALFAVTDSVYVYQASVGSYQTGTILDAGWVVGLFVIAAAGALPARAGAARAGSAPLALPAAFALVAIGVLVAATRQDVSRPIATLLAAAALLAVVARMAWTVRAHERVLARTRRESLTDELTGLGNRRSLIAELEAVCKEGREAAVGLFDLNGFKLYNDTFGHWAGDALLARLAGKLVAATPGGSAYRLGGDEFCVLVRDRTDLDSLAAATASALFEEGDGFQVSAASGWALAPRDATDPVELLRVADQRMYAEKGSQRSPARQSAAVLVAALREHDLDLDRHGGDVARHAVAMAERLGMTAPAVELVRQTAELHDVGKVAIPDAILNKPGRLDAEEWRYVRAHTIVGERILLAAPALRQVGALVRSTHERWDGRGYPDGLAGTDIPLPARIVAVCDAFDAMTSNRPYRAAMSAEAALAELNRCAGAAFDPELVEHFCAMQAALSRQVPNTV